MCNQTPHSLKDLFAQEPNTPELRQQIMLALRQVQACHSDEIGELVMFWRLTTKTIRDAADFARVTAAMEHYWDSFLTQAYHVTRSNPALETEQQCFDAILATLSPTRMLILNKHVEDRGLTGSRAIQLAIIAGQACRSCPRTDCDGPDLGDALNHKGPASKPRDAPDAPNTPCAPGVN